MVGGIAKSARLPDAVRFAIRRQGSVYEYVTEVGGGSKADMEGKGELKTIISGIRAKL